MLRQRIRGYDLSGEVEAAGPQATRFQPGDKIFGWCTGGFAEYVAIPEANLVPMPPGITFEQAAAVPMAGMVALQALREIGDVQSGRQVLVVGTSGGIGTFAVQIAKAMGAHATGVCSTANTDLVRSIGADEVIDYTKEDFTLSERRYDLILDIADTHSFADRRRLLTAHGVLVPNSGVVCPGSWWRGCCRRSCHRSCIPSCPSRNGKIWSPWPG